jgi:trehalose 6-phosphate phosphatase
VSTLQRDEVLEPLRADPRRSAVLCDVDGTLAPIVPRPSDAAVPEATRAVLRELAEVYGIVACISGRRAVEARRIVGLTGVTYIGNHGFEVLDPGNEEPRVDPRVSREAGQVHELVDSLDPAWLEASGFRVEDKGPIQTLHWRGASDEAAAEDEARSLATQAEKRGVRPRWGRKVLELRPATEIDKGSAMTGLLLERDAAKALYGGDDVTDLDAFRALRAMQSEGTLEHAVCVGVTSDEEPAELRDLSDVLVAGTEGFRELLGELRPQS